MTGKSLINKIPRAYARGNLLLIDFKGFGKTLQMEGYSYQQLLEVMEERFGHDPDLFQKKIKILERGPKR